MKHAGLIVTSALAGVLGLLLLGFGYLGAPRHALFSYLTVYLYVLTLALGSLVLLFIGHVTRARWFVVMRRAPELFTALFPLLALLALPLLWQLPELYPWARPLDELPRHIASAVEEKRGYLSVPFFVLRAAGYLLFWIVTAELLRLWSRRQDHDDDAALAWRQRALSAGLLPAFAFTLTFASFDWIMSLTPTWYSNALGFYLFTGAFIGGLALLIVVGERARFSLRLARDSERSLFHVAGKLLLVAVILWAYIAFSQFFLMWIADLPEEDLYQLPVPASQPKSTELAGASAASLPDSTAGTMWAAWASVSGINFTVWLIIVLTTGWVYPWWIWVAGPWGAMLLIGSIFGGRRSG